MKPPLLPSETLTRVLRLARFDGMGVLVVSGGVALLAASAKDVTGAVVGLIFSGAGAIELHGVGLLRSHRASGMRWLVMSQLYLVTAVLAYVASQVARPNLAPIMQFITASPLADIYEQLAADRGVTLKEFMLSSFYKFYFSVAVLTVIYQGGMTLYYLRRRRAVEIALLQEDGQ
jgi:hypothetical protein